MKYKMAPNSLFAILLRNPWWYSVLIAGVISAMCAALMPKDLVVFGIIGTFPFLVIAAMALKRQWNTPSAAAVEAETARLAGLSWREFSAELNAKFVKQGYSVTRLGANASGSAADFRLEKAGQVTLVAAKRYKAATHGVEPLRELHAAIQREGADSGLYLAGNGTLSDSARIFARDHGITVLDGNAIGALLIASR